MKKHIKSLLLVALFACVSLSAWSQASTEGKEFWVALNMTTGTGGDAHEPFICITTQYPGGSYTITNPADASFAPITGQIPPTGYIKIKASANPSGNDIDLNKWYPVGQTAQTMSNQIKNVGLKITTTVVSSVYAGNRLPQSFDAANILPITALQTEYITQDYPGFDHENKGGGYPVTTILATEDNTQVTVVPSSSVLNSNGTATIIKTLNAGQVLYITGENRASLSGSVVTSDKKIAVFTGVNNTDVPGPVSARDHLYEQNMPTDYWGTHFVVTRSMKKDANRIRITAKENGTHIFVDGSANPVATINSGETYELELCSATMRTQDGYTKALSEGRGTEYYLEGDAHYLETSCPCAVFSYDVSENYYIKKDGTSERDGNAAGDPAMVWISPLEQQLRKVTFGVMNTDQTPTHYVNIITLTSAASTLEVKEVAMNAGQVVYGNNLVQPSDVMPVPGNSAYSYARIKLNENKESVYTITSSIGFIAHVYGSGNKESYAYSAGSAAVVQGVNVNGETFTDGYRSDSKFCMDTILIFNANVGTDDISRVDWRFGDGTSEYNAEAEVTHSYAVPGWYDVQAELYGHQVCTDEDNQWLGSVKFSLRVVKPDTIYNPLTHFCIDKDSILNGDKLTAEEVAYYLTYGGTTYEQEDCASDVYITPVVYDIETIEILDTLTGNDQVVGYNNTTYYASQDVEDIIDPIGMDCRRYLRYYVNVRTCIDLDIANNAEAQHICPGETLELNYTFTKGNIDGDAVFRVPGMRDTTVTIPDTYTTVGLLELPTSHITKPGYYAGKIIVNDLHCGEQRTYPVDFAVNYPDSIFRFKFNNVLAVYTPGHGGNTGYEFRNYEWHLVREAVDSIIGTGVSVLYLGQGVTFQNGDSVYVVLTDMSGMELRSCSQTLYEIPDYNLKDEGGDEDDDDSQQAPARKMIIKQQFVIRKGDVLFDIYGQRIH